MLSFCVFKCVHVNACSHTCICALPALKPLSDLSSEVTEAPSGEALNDYEMLMQLIREAKSREERGQNKGGGPGRVKTRAKAKIKSAKERGRVRINYRFVVLSELVES